jgi:hypothetical protein
MSALRPHLGITNQTEADHLPGRGSGLRVSAAGRVAFGRVGAAPHKQRLKQEWCTTYTLARGGGNACSQSLG